MQVSHRQSMRTPVTLDAGIHVRLTSALEAQVAVHTVALR